MNKKPSYQDLEQQIKDYESGKEEIFKQLIKNSFDMFILINEEGKQHFISESCEKILGFLPEELLNIPIIEHMIHPDDQEKNARLIGAFTEVIRYYGGK